MTYSIAKGASGGQVNSSFSTTPYAVCFTSSLINHTQVVMNKANTPTTATTVGLVTATCPANTVLLGGGALLTPGNTGTFKPIATFPTFNNAAHDYGRKAAADRETNPDSGSAVGGIGGGRDSGNMTYAYAICSGDDVNVRNITTTVHFRGLSGPEVAGTHQTATVGCDDPDGGHGNGRTHDVLVSGGAAVSGGKVTTTDFSKAGSQGTHLTGSYPSDSDGNPVSDGSTTPAYWMADIHVGGSPSPNTYSDVRALCLNLDRAGER
ncbi:MULTISPECIES: hypothetical protein [unclassified Kitasatospora]|uniref:hypothetical protein n=1 Tax=unclassified Kitasatospora TaxID=2633591 RepID=UPI0033EB41E5